ncbi:MAG: hypothetical protein CK428_31770 [Mycobacterium sp.]|jgi:hypothetical protein|nr:MAG: hypothetical protein CK428_31770 [Mycobacterium sp.]
MTPAGVRQLQDLRRALLHPPRQLRPQHAPNSAGSTTEAISQRRNITHRSQKLRRPIYTGFRTPPRFAPVVRRLPCVTVAAPVIMHEPCCPLSRLRHPPQWDGFGRPGTPERSPCTVEAYRPGRRWPDHARRRTQIPASGRPIKKPGSAVAPAYSVGQRYVTVTH